MTASRNRPVPPVARRQTQYLSLHGITRTDDYAWLRDENWQDLMNDPSVLAAPIRTYLEAENAYTGAVMQDTEALQAALFAELRGRIKEDDSSVPDLDGDYAYYVRYREGGQYPIFCRRPAAAPEREETLFDGDAEAGDRGYFQVTGFQQSPDHRCIAYCVDDKGSEFYTLHVRDLESGAQLNDPIPGVQGDIAWAADSRHLFYTALDRHRRPDRVLRHRPGDAVERDAVVYRERDPGFFVHIDKTSSRRFITIHTQDQVTSEAWLIDAATPRAQALLVQAREREIKYAVEEHAGRLLIMTNADGAEDYKLVTVDPADPGRGKWRDFHLPGPGILLLDLVVFRRWLVRLERREGLPRLAVMEMDANGACTSEHSIAFDEPCYELTPVSTFDYDADTLRFVYTSMTTPRRTYDYDMRKRTRVLRKQQEVPSGHDPDAYITRHLFAPAPDGARVPISLLYAKTTPLDGSAPLLLYGYGAYGLSVPASFSGNRLSLVNRGFLFAIAHVRGGMEKGYAWYRTGKLKGKTNTFRDFIACADYLIEQGCTRRGEIAIEGASAGGLLVGAALNLRPDLLKAAIADVPFVDMLNTMCDDTLPLTPIEWPEWGNPVTDADACKRIASYSPFDNVARRDYPNMLVTAGLSDPRVTYWEPAKWVAKLRACKTDENLLLLKTNMEAGHGGASGRFDYLKEIALKYAFLLKVYGMEDSA